MSENHPPAVSGWARGAWRLLWLSGLADIYRFILERVGSFLANCFVWFGLSKELLLTVGMFLLWHPLSPGFCGWFLGLGFFVVVGCLVGWCKVWNEAGQCRGDCSEFSALVRREIHQPHQSNNFIVVALGGRPLANSCALWKTGWVHVGSKWFWHLLFAFEVHRAHFDSKFRNNTPKNK